MYTHTHKRRHIHTLHYNKASLYLHTQHANKTDDYTHSNKRHSELSMTLKYVGCKLCFAIVGIHSLKTNQRFNGPLNRYSNTSFSEFQRQASILKYNIDGAIN